MPNEFQLADEFGVSQGTVRKALDALAAEHLVERHQGRGTFVARHTSDTVHFRFFQLYGAGGRIQPKAAICRSRGCAERMEQAALALAGRARDPHLAHPHARGRADHRRVHFAVRSALFSELLSRETVPNTLYDLYQTDFGITVARVEENLRAVAASDATARRLSCAVGTPVLAIERVAFDYGGQPVEWRVSHCLTDNAFYHTTLK